MPLNSSINHIQEIIDNLNTIKKIKKPKPLKKLYSNNILTKNNKKILSQLESFFHNIKNNFQRFYHTNQQTLLIKSDNLKKKFKIYKETVNNENYKNSFDKIKNLKNNIVEIKKLELNKKIHFNKIESQKIFDEINDEIEIDKEINDVLEDKFLFDVEFVDEREIEVLENMVFILESI